MLLIVRPAPTLNLQLSLNLYKTLTYYPETVSIVILVVWDQES